MVAVALALVVSACGGGDDGGDGTSATTDAPAALGVVEHVLASYDGEPVPLEIEVLETIPIAPDAFAQGFEFDDEGRLFKSTGRYGESSLRELDPETGETLRQRALGDEWFAEGLTLLDEHFVLLTWRENTAFRIDPETLEEVDRWEYEGEGWGICADDGRLLMTDGTDQLITRDPADFEVVEQVTITRAERRVEDVNELECHGGVVWANIWREDVVVVIDPDTGEILAEADASHLLTPQERAGADVLNGIAHIPGTDEMLLTGKLWPAMFRVRFVPA